MNASWSLIQYPALFKRNDPRDGYDSHIDSGQIDYSFVIIQSSQSLHLKSQCYNTQPNGKIVNLSDEYR